ncbi:MAG: response regulator transcription factor [Thermoflexales bacterium]|nr:response regulator transcription factor [Thermoflexales bacterium]
MAQRILVVDDDPQIARLVQTYLEQAGFTTQVASNGEDALHAIRADKPDLVVLDLMLPDRSGWEITRIVRQDPTTSTLPIIMLTARVEETDRIIGLELGADDYVPKPFNPRELTARARAVLRRAVGAPPAPRVLRSGELSLDLDGRALEIGGRAIDVTPTEFDLLKAFLEQPNHAYTRLELIERALGYAYAGMERTLDSHIKNLRRKIEADPAHPLYIETVYGVGYRWGLRG